MFLAKDLCIDALTKLIDTGEYLEAPMLGLMKTAPSPNSELTKAEIVPSTFDDYAPAACANPVGPFVNQHGERYVTYDDVIFTVGDELAETENVVGWYLYDGDDLLAWHVFDTPLVIDRVGQVLFVRPEVSIGLSSMATGDIDAP